MVFNTFLDSLRKFQWGTHVSVDDFADRLNSLVTVAVLLVCVSMVSVRQYVLKPISCYLSTDIGGVNLLQYVENFCWVHGTVPLSYNGSTPNTDREWALLDKYKILYYQWVPFVLGIQCIMFHIPRLIWQMMCYNHTGTDIQHLITSANQAVHSNEETKNKMTIYIAKTIEHMLYQHRDNRSGRLAQLRRRIYNSFPFCIISKRMGTLIVMGYFCIKLLYISNIILQLFLMKNFLGLSDISYFGYEVLNNILNGNDWQITLIFPRVSFCYARIRHVGARNNAVIAQCVLTVNMLNEKIYIFLWHWIIFCGLITFLSLLLWIFRIGMLNNNKYFIRKLLLLNDRIVRYDYNHREMVIKFMKQFLRHDGVFLLRMMAINTGDIVTGEVVCHLWDIYKNQYKNLNLTADFVKVVIKDGNCVPFTASASHSYFKTKNCRLAPNGFFEASVPSAPEARPFCSNESSTVV